jgi:hypothetical protein
MRPLHELVRIGAGLLQFLNQRTGLFGLTTRAVRAAAITELLPGKAFAGGRITITRTSAGAASCIRYLQHERCDEAGLFSRTAPFHLICMSSGTGQASGTK